jgi:hypothetical protein
MVNVSKKIVKMLNFFDKIYADNPYDEIWFNVTKALDSSVIEIDNISENIIIQAKNKLTKHD